MGYLIRGTRGAVVKAEGQELKISADQFREVQTVQIGEPASKEDSEIWLKRFEAETKLGPLVWDVTFSLDLSGANFESSCLASAPAGVEVLKEPEFELVEC
ncbi:hypothetical protein SAMN05216201_11399 [Pseudomonas linyingensis]|uniref:Uncharacterized protein n=1 Tax=Pseudomonas linyingensis TaxID=915471 RepID=A0A1H7AW31_9PSED|nr:hypothetical protein [Pseudomonas linyingensis]SEJ66312.1 hypothetical protein SAMN05216201_11399 [Pseudomonas linyingensis]